MKCELAGLISYLLQLLQIFNCTSMQRYNCTKTGKRLIEIVGKTWVFHFTDVTLKLAQDGSIPASHHPSLWARATETPGSSASSPLQVWGFISFLLQIPHFTPWHWQREDSDPKPQLSHRSAETNSSSSKCRVFASPSAGRLTPSRRLLLPGAPLQRLQQCPVQSLHSFLSSPQRTVNGAALQFLLGQHSCSSGSCLPACHGVGNFLNLQTVWLEKSQDKKKWFFCLCFSTDLKAFFFFFFSLSQTQKYLNFL